MPDTQRSAGDSAQVRIIVEQALDAAIVKLGGVPSTPKTKPEKMEIPAPLKWAGVIVASLMTLLTGSLALWLVTTLNDMQLTVARIDERQQSQAGDLDGRFEEVNRRLARVEAAIGEPRRQGDGR